MQFSDGTARHVRRYEMNKDSEANEEKPKVKRAKARTKSYVDAGPPQFEETATLPSHSEGKQLDVEAMPSQDVDVMDGGPAPAAPTES
jgi:hypothetical protein